MRKQIDYNKVVDVADDGTITMLDYVFEDGNMRGAVGTRFVPVSKEFYDEYTSKESLIEYLMDSQVEVPDCYKRGGYEAWADGIINCGDVGEFMFDQSYSEHWDYLRGTLDLTEDEAYIFECIGGGRCFDKNYVGNKDANLSAIIRRYESDEKTY